MFSSADDLARFAMFQLKDHLPDQEPVISDSSIDEMQTASVPSVEGPELRRGLAPKHYQTHRGARRLLSGGFGDRPACSQRGRRCCRLDEHQQRRTADCSKLDCRRPIENELVGQIHGLLNTPDANRSQPYILRFELKKSADVMSGAVNTWHFQDPNGSRLSEWVSLAKQ